MERPVASGTCAPRAREQRRFPLQFFPGYDSTAGQNVKRADACIRRGALDDVMAPNWVLI